MVTIQTKSLKAGKQVDTKHVDNAIRNYKQERWAQNSERLGKADSLSVWYSIEELEEFIALSKEHGADGLKMYFGAYDKNNTEDPLRAGRQTIVIVATKHKEGNTNKDVYIQTEQGSSVLAYNMGAICPPFCGKDGGLGVTILDKGEEGFVLV
ncbi:hypothetical protein LZZ85_09090 [Terrimonas sp. NA20]|uniref:Uncharacterized protein n=1 Tax=Terrimonas ginsenosidimutans TaxID=2908004 RepID=A0ABS9KQ29_9BACT|nr:hypothetical protein [Terrimonas ginsenosidimutans]MCG2614434.1 hypothetical protein [Terrimonas ginsenosidimutans]